MSEAVWSLHPQLQNDTAPVGDLALCRVVSINDADYPWLILVPRRSGVTEIADLGGDASLLIDEIALVSRVLKHVTRWTSSTSRRSAISCRSFTSTSSRAGRAIRCGRSRSGVLRRSAQAIPWLSRASSQRSATGCRESPASIGGGETPARLGRLVGRLGEHFEHGLDGSRHGGDDARDTAPDGRGIFGAKR